MTVYIDGRWSGQHGIARYASEITARLPFPTSRADTRIAPASSLDPLWLAYKLHRNRHRAYFTPGFNAAASRLPQLLVLHDLIHLRVPEESTSLKRAYYEHLVKPAVLRTNSVITVSEFSRAAIAEWCGIDQESVIVAPGALSSSFLEAGPGDARGPDPVDPFILYVGNGKPHKNVGLLFRAMKRMPDLSLICVGLTPDDVHNVNSLPRAPRLLQGVSDAELAALYRRAQCLAFPSLYEGFGLPALEALSQGTPVAYICDAVKETVGADCGVQAAGDATPEEFAQCMEQAIGLRTRDDFAQRASTRVATVSWDASALKVSKAIQGMLDKSV